MIKRIFVEKKRTVSNLADNLCRELNLQLKVSIGSLRCFIRYDIEGLEGDDFNTAIGTVFSEPPVDDVYFENLPALTGYTVFEVEYLPGQYDLRADSAVQCVQLLTMGTLPKIRCATVYAVSGAVDETAVPDIQKIQNYLVNPVDSRIASNEKPASLTQKILSPENVKKIAGFRSFDKTQMQTFRAQYALAMSLDDVQFVQQYFAA